MTGDVFGALANPVRRKLLEALRTGPHSAGDLAGRFALSRPAVSEHLAVLRNANLVREEPRGRHRYYHLAAAPLAEVGEWLHPFEHYWRARLTALRDLIDKESDLTAPEPDVIRCDQFIAHPPAAVWHALTDPELHAKWWAAGDVRPIVGHRFTLDMGPWGEQPCEVLTVEPERLLRYAFAEGTLDTTITWRLEPEGTGTRLFLEHKGFDLNTPAGRAALDGMGRGWPGLLQRIEPILAEPTDQLP